MTFKLTSTVSGDKIQAPRFKNLRFRTPGIYPKFEHEYTNFNSILVEKLPMFICRHINHLRSMAYKEPTRRAFWLKVSFHLMAMILSKLIINIDITLIVIKIRTITIIPTRIAMIPYIDIIIISIISTFILIAVITATLYIFPTGLVQQYREG